MVTVPSSRYGYCPAAHPHTTAATASPAVARARPWRRLASNTSVPAPPTAEATMSGAARLVSPANSSGASARSTAIPPSAITPVTTPAHSPPHAKRIRQPFGALPRGVAGQENRGQKRTHRNGEDAAEQGRGVQPAGPRVSGGVLAVAVCA